MKSVHVEFISDYICPWCYIGKARLERVQEQIGADVHLNIDVKPYLLYPSIPIGGVPKAVFASKTKPGMGRSLRAESEVEGIEINYKKIERIPNSLEAHRLTWLTAADKKYELAKGIFKGYFEEGQNIEDQDYLIEQAKSVGVAKKTIGLFFSTESGKQEVLSSIQNSKEHTATVVPSLRLANKIMIPGLQPSDVWATYIKRAAALH